MRNWLTFIAVVVLSSPVLGQGANNNVGEAEKAEYLTILENAQKNKKVKVANLSSSDRKNDDASLRPIREADVMFKVRLWTRLNFNEKINNSFSSDQSQLVNLIYEGVEEYFTNPEDTTGIAPYKDEAQYERTNFGNQEPLLSREEWLEAITNNLRVVEDPSTAEIDARVSELRLQTEYQSTAVTALNDIADRQLKAERQAAAYFDKEAKFTEIIIEEDLVFDKNHSLPMWDIISFTIVSPLTNGSKQNLFKVKYADVKHYLDKVFKETDGDNAFWFNPQNPGNRSLSFSDAIDKRMFNSYIVSVENVDNADILNGFVAKDNYNALVFAEKIRLQLLERMHNLWEY